MNIAVVNFSSRSSGNCAKISEFISDYYKRTNVRSYSADKISPCGGCDYECLQPGKECTELSIIQREIMDSICASDLVYFIIPNYCGFPCANYLAYNEHCVGYFNLDRQKMSQYMSIKKRFIVVSNTETEVFKQAMKQQTNGEPNALYLKSSRYGKKSIAGDILESEAAQADLMAFLCNDPS